VSQKGKTNLDFTEARDSEWQWHLLGRMQVCTSLQSGNHASTPPLSFFTGRMPFLPPNQQRLSTEGNLCNKSKTTLTRSQDTADHHSRRGPCTACTEVLEDSQGSPSSCSSPGCHRSTIATTHTHHQMPDSATGPMLPLVGQL